MFIESICDPHSPEIGEREFSQFLSEAKRKYSGEEEIALNTFYLPKFGIIKVFLTLNFVLIILKKQ